MIRGKKVPVDSRRVNVDVKCSLHNRFDIEVIDAATGIVKQRTYAENVICNQLWTRLLTPNEYFTHIHYGTGSGTPSASDTSLFTFLGYKTPQSADDAYNVGDDWASLTKKIQLDENTANGQTLTEVGIAYGTGSGTLCTHAMLKDMNGNQISISKTNTDILNIYATVFAHWDNSRYVDVLQVNIDPSGSGFLKYLLLGGSSGNASGPKFINFINGYSESSTNIVSTTFSNTYNAASKTITCIGSRLAAADANYGGFCKGIAFAGSSPTFSPAFYFTNLGNTIITGEAIGTGDGIATDFATAFPFPSTSKIYVNGAEQTSGVTVYPEPLAVADMGRYFEGLSADSTPGNHIYSPRRVPSNVFGTTLTGEFNHYYNPYYALGVASFYREMCSISVSDDFSAWVQIAAHGNGTISVPEGHQNSKYWRVTRTGTNSTFHTITLPSAYNGKPVKFTTPPASGAVITADYTTPVIAKDSNHVYDFSMTITLGEKTV